MNRGTIDQHIGLVDRLERLFQKPPAKREAAVTDLNRPVDLLLELKACTGQLEDAAALLYPKSPFAAQQFFRKALRFREQIARAEQKP